MNEDAGKIYHQQAFAQGKMVHSAGWNGLLPRGCTASDIDWMMDNRGRFCFVEYTRSCSHWSELKRGQFYIHRNLLNELRPLRSISVLARHNVPLNRVIDSFLDIEEIEVMYMDNQCRLHFQYFTGVQTWQQLIVSWMQPCFDFVDWMNTLSKVDDPHDEVSDADAQEYVEEAYAENSLFDSYPGLSDFRDGLFEYPDLNEAERDE